MKKFKRVSNSKVFQIVVGALKKYVTIVKAFSFGVYKKQSFLAHLF
jgi:hypothetical protein